MWLKEEKEIHNSCHLPGNWAATGTRRALARAMSRTPRPRTDRDSMTLPGSWGRNLAQTGKDPCHSPLVMMLVTEPIFEVTSFWLRIPCSFHFPALLPRRQNHSQPRMESKPAFTDLLKLSGSPHLLAHRMLTRREAALCRPCHIGEETEAGAGSSQPCELLCRPDAGGTQCSTEGRTWRSTLCL